MIKIFWGQIRGNPKHVVILSVIILLQFVHAKNENFFPILKNKKQPNILKFLQRISLCN